MGLKKDKNYCSLTSNSFKEQYDCLLKYKISIPADFCFLIYKYGKEKDKDDEKFGKCMKEYYPELKALQCLYLTHDFMQSVINLKGVTANVRPEDISECFHNQSLPIKYMNCKLHNNIYHYWV